MKQAQGAYSTDDHLHIQNVNIQSYSSGAVRKVEQHAHLTEHLHVLLFSLLHNYQSLLEIVFISSPGIFLNYQKLTPICVRTR